MQKEQAQTLLEAQREYFLSGATLPVAARKKALKKLYAAILANEERLYSALKQDLGKSKTEAYTCEIGLTLSEITYMLRHLKSFCKTRRVKTPLAHFPARSEILPSPYGNVLIMSPWNYPVLLSLEPLVDAIAAGNTAVIKPSAYSPATSQALADLIENTFPPEYVAVAQGGRQENEFLTQLRFDKIFFTGSKAVGREVMKKAAQNLVPVTLELGGKSPCVVDESADIPLAARRIVFGKFLNCGQTCVAPDYILCHESVKERLIPELKKQICLQFGSEPLKNPDYGKIVSEKHFRRIIGLIEQEKVVYGGQTDEEQLKISPTVMENVTFFDRVMQEEIFGPVLPVIYYSDLQSVMQTLSELPAPLAFYVFSTNEKTIDLLLTRQKFGGGCVNDVIVHLATSEMAFGGVGESGMGAYHGKRGFEEFTHDKSVLRKKSLDLPMRYQPYTAKHEKLIRKFMK